MDHGMEQGKTMELINPNFSTYFIKRSHDGSYDEGMLDPPLDILKTDLQAAILNDKRKPCGKADAFLMENCKIMPRLIRIVDDGRPSDEIMMDVIRSAYRNGHDSVVLCADNIDEIIEAAESIRKQLPEYPWVNAVYFIYPSDTKD